MKALEYKLFGAIFHLYRLFPVNKNKIVLFMGHDCKFQGNIRYVYEEMKQRNEKFQFKIFSKKQLNQSKLGMLKFFFQMNFHMATAKYVFLNDNFMPLKYMNPSKHTKFVQLWHGVGAFKRFGLSTETDPFVRACVQDGNRKISVLTVSSPHVVPFYEEALAIDREKILSTGVPLTDFYFNEFQKERAKEKVYEQFPEWRNKKVLLYTPTFRNTKEQNIDIMKHFDMKKVSDALGEDWVVLIRLHPQVKECMPPLEKNCYDVTEYPDIKGLFMVSNALVADYSSTIVEYALLDKPILLYDYDLEEYDRGFYESYREIAPGELLCDEEAFLAYLKNVPKHVHYDAFIDLEYGNQVDGHATKRLVDYLWDQERGC